MRLFPVTVRFDKERQKDSPASNGGRGLKHHEKRRLGQRLGDSPASNGGRGLKHALRQRHDHSRHGIRPPAMAGVD